MEDEWLEHPEREAEAAAPSDTELIAALFRVALILVALTVWACTKLTLQPDVYYLTITVLVFNVVLIASYWRRASVPWIRPFAFLAELLLLSMWIRALPLRAEHLFFLFYITVIVASLTFGLLGAALTAAGAIGIFLLIVPPPDIRWRYIQDMAFTQFTPLVIVAVVSGILVNVRDREREARFARERVLMEFRQRIRIAREVYEFSVPRELPQIPGVEVGVAARVADYAVGGGDYYDIVPLGERGFALAVADIAGKTLPGVAKLPMVKYAFRMCAEVYDAPQEIARRLNALFCEHTEEDSFVSMFLALFKPETGELSYVNAGQVPPMLISGEQGETEWLGLGGPALGIIRGARYEQAAVRLRPGDVLVLCTDGVTAAANVREEEFGMERLLREAQARLAQPAQDIAQALLSAAEQFQGRGRRDDALVMVIKAGAGPG